MPIKTQLWHPDTCDRPSCVIEETYDTADPGGPMTMSAVLRTCPAHAAVADVDLYNVLYKNPDSDQKRKNLSEKYFVETDALNLNKTQPDGTKAWKDGVTYGWAFSGVPCRPTFGSGRRVGRRLCGLNRLGR